MKYNAVRIAALFQSRKRILKNKRRSVADASIMMNERYESDIRISEMLLARSDKTGKMDTRKGYSGRGVLEDFMNQRSNEGSDKLPTGTGARILDKHLSSMRLKFSSVRLRNMKILLTKSTKRRSKTILEMLRDLKATRG